MADGQERMVPEHARSGIAHHLFYAFPPLRKVTMNRACIARRLIGPERAFFNPLARIGKKLFATAAKSIAASVVCAAVDPDHNFNGSGFQVHDPVCS